MSFGDERARTRAGWLAGLLAVAALTLGGCASEAPGTPAADPTETPAGEDPGGIVGTWSDPGSADGTSITFESSGTFVADDGCNTLNGEYTVDDATIGIATGASTEMACERETWLGGAVEAQRSGDALTFFDDDAQRLGELRRAS